MIRDIEDVQDLTRFQELLMAAYDELRTQRKRHKVSDADFARWLGVTPSSLGQWSAGNRAPDIASAIQLSKRLGLEVFDALGYERIPVITDRRLALIVDAWQTLTPDQRAEISSYVKELADKATHEG